MNKNIKKKISMLTGAILLASVISSYNASAITSNYTKTERLGGSNRYSTAVEISKDGWTKSDYAIIARGDNYADALCAAPLAKLYNAPILLTENNKLNAETENRLKSLGVKKVFIIGGIGAISASVESSLSNLNIQSERLGGSNRYETSTAIANKIGAKSSVVLASGDSFADALSIASIAANKEIPILLTDKTSLPQTVSNYITNNNVTKTYLVGGTSVIADTIQSNVPDPTRLSGSDRYETNVAVINYFIDDLNLDKIYVAVGSDFADALSGSALAAKDVSPIVLVDKNVSDSTKNFMLDEGSPSTTVTVLGGESVVSSSLVDTVKVPGVIYDVPSKVYGSTFGKSVIDGNVALSADNIQLKNTKVNGTLYVNPGAEGDIVLNNIEATNIKILSGGQNSIHLNNVKATNLEIDKKGTNDPVRIVADANTVITNTLVKGDAKLETDPSKEAFGTVTISPTKVKTIELKGRFGTVNVATNSSVNVDPNTIINRLSAANSATNVNLNVPSNSTINQASGNLNVTGDGKDNVVVVSNEFANFVDTVKPVIAQLFGNNIDNLDVKGNTVNGTIKNSDITLAELFTTKENVTYAQATTLINSLKNSGITANGKTMFDFLVDNLRAKNSSSILANFLTSPSETSFNAYKAMPNSELKALVLSKLTNLDEDKISIPSINVAGFGKLTDIKVNDTSILNSDKNAIIVSTLKSAAGIASDRKITSIKLSELTGKTLVFTFEKQTLTINLNAAQ